jgi:antitoxin YefM
MVMGSCRVQMTDAKHIMKQFNLEGVQENFEQVFGDVLLSGEPVKIAGDTGDAVLVSEEVWRGMTETLYLLSIPNMRVSVRAGMREHIATTATDLDL